MNGYDGDEPTWDLQMLVNQDLDRILKYGREHLDEYGGRWMNRADRTYGVSVTGSLERHQAALGTILNLPKRLKIRRCRYSLAELEDVCHRLRTEDQDLSEVDEKGRPALYGYGPDEKAGVVSVHVQRGRLDVAERLMAKYGPQITVELGDWLNIAFATGS